MNYGKLGVPEWLLAKERSRQAHYAVYHFMFFFFIPGFVDYNRAGLGRRDFAAKIMVCFFSSSK
jgi:hypothetical protein